MRKSFKTCDLKIESLMKDFKLSNTKSLEDAITELFSYLDLAALLKSYLWSCPSHESPLCVEVSVVARLEIQRQNPKETLYRVLRVVQNETRKRI